MEVNTRRRYFNRFATVVAALQKHQSFSLGSLRPVAHRQPAPQGIGLAAAATHTTESIISPALVLMTAIPKTDHILVTDPFEKHVSRTMDALKKVG